MAKNININIKIILSFIAGAIIFGGVGIYAATLSFSSGDVAHTKTDGTATTVKSAINELYEKAQSSGQRVALYNDVGNGSYNVKTLVEDYDKLTANNFMFVPTRLSSSGGEGGVGGVSNGGTVNASSTPALSYNSSTGIVTISGCSCSYTKDTVHNGVDHIYTSTSASITGTIYFVK